MFISATLTLSVVLSTILCALGYPGMEMRLARLLLDGQENEEGDSTELLGDLVTLPDSQLTLEGSEIKQILLGKGFPQSDAAYGYVPPLRSAECAKDTCCVWKYIADDMVAVFRGHSGRCTKWARGAIRLGFHDAGGWSKDTAAQGGGADGSIVLNDIELTLDENNGLQPIAGKMREWYDKWHVQQGFTSVTMSDLIQMGANIATVVCPLGPRIKSYVGREDSSVQNPRLLPNPFQPADELIEMFENKTIKPHGLAALLGSHTTSQQFFVDESRAGDPQDSTPGVWDVLFYAQTLDAGATPAPERVFMFQSDVALARHPKTTDEWKEFAGPGGQKHWNEVRAISRVSLVCT